LVVGHCISCQLTGINTEPAMLFAKITPYSFLFVVKYKYFLSPKDNTSARIISPGLKHFSISILSQNSSL